MAEVEISYLDLSGRIELGQQVTRGGFSDIYMGTLNGTQVAIKFLRVQGPSGLAIIERIHKRLYRELVLWRKLQHPNVVPLLGYISNPNESAMVSPWYSNGNIISYLQSHPDAYRYGLALDVVNGLNYLHLIPVAHGDLKGENVLVDSQGQASLCDFGMSQFIDEASQIAGFTTSHSQNGGTDRFMCPEILEDKPKTTATDMWAAGSLVVQILTDKIPYHHLTAKIAVIAAIIKGQPPTPERLDFISEELWELIKKCWNVKAEERPKISEMLTHFRLTSLTYSAEVTVQRFIHPGLAISPQGNYLAVADLDHVSIFDFRMNSFIRNKTWHIAPNAASSMHPKIMNVSWNSSESMLLVRSNQFLNVFMVETGRIFLDWPPVPWADFLPDDSGIAYMASTGSIYVKSSAQVSKVLFSVRLPFLAKVRCNVYFSKDNQRVLIVTKRGLSGKSGILLSAELLKDTVVVEVVYSTKTAALETEARFSKSFVRLPRAIPMSKCGRFALIPARSELQLWEINLFEAVKVNSGLSIVKRYSRPNHSISNVLLQFGGVMDELVLVLDNYKCIHIWDRDTAALVHSFPFTPQEKIWDMSLRRNALEPRTAVLITVPWPKHGDADKLGIWTLTLPKPLPPERPKLLPEALKRLSWWRTG